LRIYFVYNRIGIWCSQEKMPATDLIMYTADLPMRAGPVKLGLLEHGRYAAHLLAGVKVTSWLENVWAAERARSRGFEDMVLLNEHGLVAECTAANIFFVQGGRVCTPPETSGCLAGVSRQILLEIAQSAGAPIEERNVTVEEMWVAEEVFISSTTREVQAVSAIEDHEYTLAPGPVTAKWHDPSRIACGATWRKRGKTCRLLTRVTRAMLAGTRKRPSAERPRSGMVTAGP